MNKYLNFFGKHCEKHLSFKFSVLPSKNVDEFCAKIMTKLVEKMPLQQCLTLSSDPCSLTRLTVLCVCRRWSKGGVFRPYPSNFPICFRNMQKSSLGASSILKHHFKPVVVSAWSLTAPKSHTQNDNHCTSACISYYSQVPTGKILPVCQENRSMLCLLWKKWEWKQWGNNVEDRMGF